jgi:hypothetical protein
MCGETVLLSSLSCTPLPCSHQFHLNVTAAVLSEDIQLSIRERMEKLEWQISIRTGE